MRIPIATYRLQFCRALGFREARRLVPYLHRLGISDVYASPIFDAHSDIGGGYDVVDPTRLNPVLGSWDDFTGFSAALREHTMGLILDIVPNHMAAHSSNRWWKDVLENGPNSPYARYFDIEWEPPSPARSGKILWPILGAPYAEVLERQELVLKFSGQGFTVQYFDRSLPIDPTTYVMILSHLPDAVPSVAGTDPARHAQELKERLWERYTADGEFHTLLDQCMAAFNGKPGDPRSVDLLDELLAQQPYVLSFWRVAREKVNYRRFFDISGLVGLNVQDPEVFAATHAFVFQLVDEGWVTGLRIDHIDGLYDPEEYLRRLRDRLPDCYIVVEKILERNEPLCPEWPVSGTTGYDFINALDSVMVDTAGLDRIAGAYTKLTGGREIFADVVYEQKKRVIEELFAGEALSLSLHLNLLAEQDRYAKDVSPQGLYSALVEVTACLPVYRTYTRSFQIRPQDLLRVDQAFQEARRRNPQVSETIWNFVRRVLLLDCPASLSAGQRTGWKQFVQRWQQFSGPVMAKGKEDTSFYIHNRLISLNEVGGQNQASSIEEFHKFAEARAKSSPHSLNAGTTHDTKRGEDVRARIHVLSEIPEIWARNVKRWQHWNARCKRVLNGAPVPCANEEYFIYQTLVGAWPVESSQMDTFDPRIQTALVKAWREAKVHSSWTHPDQDYEGAVAEFVTTILAPSAENRFLPDLAKFQQRIAAYGAVNSLSETLIRLVSPGVPDIYQGAESWELSLVDPDNRRPVDFAERERSLGKLRNCDVSCLSKNWQTGWVKQFVIQETLACRRDYADVFRSGEYIPLSATGHRARHVISLARHFGMDWVIAVAARLPAGLSKSGALPVGKSAWGDTELIVPSTAPRRWSNLFTGKTLEVSGAGATVAGILDRLPVALLRALPD